MGFYIRKSLKTGPFRFNFSKSGVGVSVGVTGFRIGTGPRGNYVHMGRNGFYYRQTIPFGSSSSRETSNINPPRVPSIHSDSSVPMEEVESGAVLAMQDSSSAALLTEMNEKARVRGIAGIAFILCSILAILFYFILMRIVYLLAVDGTARSYASCITLLALAGFVALMTVIASREDRIARTTVLFYALDSGAEQAYQALHDAFQRVASCPRIRHISASGRIVDWQTRKREAGATSLVRHNRIFLSCKAPPYIETNVLVPAIPVGRQYLHFFPDRILVLEGRKVGAVPYSDVQLDVGEEAFIEEEGVPQGTEIIRHTWKYVNKDGGPDRRYSNNYQIPVVRYGIMHFVSLAGLNELIQVSRTDVGRGLADALRTLASLQDRETVTQTSANVEGTLLDDAVIAYEQADAARGLRLIIDVIKTDPKNEKAWLMLAAAIDDFERKRECVERALTINPDYSLAHQYLSALDRNKGLAEVEALLLPRCVPHKVDP